MGFTYWSDNVDGLTEPLHERMQKRVDILKAKVNAEGAGFHKEVYLLELVDIYTHWVSIYNNELAKKQKEIDTKCNIRDRDETKACGMVVDSSGDCVGCD